MSKMRFIFTSLPIDEGEVILDRDRQRHPQLFARLHELTESRRDKGGGGACGRMEGKTRGGRKEGFGMKTNEAYGQGALASARDGTPSLGERSIESPHALSFPVSLCLATFPPLSALPAGSRGAPWSRRTRSRWTDPSTVSCRI